MSDMWTDEDLDDLLGDPTQDNNTIGLLRKKIKADAMAMKEMRQEVASLRDHRRGEIVSEALKSAGLSPGAASLYQGETDPAAVQAWVEQNKGFIAPAQGFTPPPATDPEAQSGAGAPAQGTQTVFTPDSQAAYQRMMSAGVDGVPGSNFNDAYGALTNANSMEDLLGVISQYS